MSKSPLTFGWVPGKGRVHILAANGLCVCLMPASGLTEFSEAMPRGVLPCSSCRTLLKGQRAALECKPVKLKNRIKAQNKKIRAFGKRQKRSRKQLLPPTVWQKLRYAALKRSDGKCELCGANKARGAILHVDHIRPVSKYPELARDPDNLQVLCCDCNMGKYNIDETDWRTKDGATKSHLA